MPVVSLGAATEADKPNVISLGPVDTGVYEDTPDNSVTRSDKTFGLAEQTGIPLEEADELTFQQAGVDLEKQRRTMLKTTRWINRTSIREGFQTTDLVTEQQAREEDEQKVELARALAAGEIKEPPLVEVSRQRLIVPDRIATNRSLVYAYINLPSFREAIDADLQILDGVSFAGPESKDTARLYNEIKPFLEEIVRLNQESDEHPTWSAIKGIGKGILNIGLDNMGIDTSDTKGLIQRGERIAKLDRSENLSDRVAAATLKRMNTTAWLASLPGSINAPFAIWNTATLGVAPLPTLQFTPEQRGMTNIFSVAALLIPHSPANALFKLGRSAVGNTGTRAFEGFATKFPAAGGAIASIVSKPFVNRLAAIPVEFAKLKGGQLSFAIFQPSNLKRVNDGEHPMAVAQDIFTQWFNVDPTTALFATVFGFAKGLKLDTPAGRAAQAARHEALKQLGLKPIATNADVRLAMGEWGRIQSTLVESRIPVPPPAPLSVPVVITKLRGALKTSLKEQKKVSKVKVKAQSVERGKRTTKADDLFNKFRAQGDDVPTASRKSLSALGGKLTEEEVPLSQRPQLTKPEWDAMHQKVTQTFPGKGNFFTRLNHTTAIEKMRAGQVLQQKEVVLMADMFGDKLGRQLSRQLGLAERVARTASDLLGLPRTLMAGGDDSFVGRQLAVVAANDLGNLLHLRINLKKPLDSFAFAQASARSLLAFFSEKQFQRFKERIENHPIFDFAVESGLSITRVGAFAKSGERIEAAPSRIASRWPLIKQGNRAAVIAGNWSRIAVFDRIIGNLERRGIPISPQTARRIAGQVNDMTGRAGIPKGETMAAGFDFLNKLVFSPRFALSKIRNVVTLHHTLSRDPAVRAEGFRTLTGHVAMTAAIAGTARLFGAEVGFDPRATNFMKVRVGNIWIDILPGEGQVIRFMARMAFGKTTTAAGHVRGTDLKDEVERFAKAKSAPIVNMMRTIWTGRTFIGEKIEGIEGWTKETFRNFTFLWLQDGIDAFVDEYGKEGSALNLAATTAAVTGAAWMGVSIQVYPDSPRTSLTILKDELSQEAFEKPWLDLGPEQHRELSDRFQDRLDRAKQDVDIEIQERADFAFASRMLEEADEAAKEMIGMLNKDSQVLMALAKTTLGLGTNLQRATARSEWVMNDKWFKRYQELTAVFLDEELAFLIQSPDWDKQLDEDKKRDITIAVRVSKTQARIDVIGEADDEALEQEITKD